MIYHRASPYANVRHFSYNYASGLDANISRMTSMSDSSATLETDTYLGLGTLVQRNFNQPGVSLSYIQQAGDNQYNSDGGDRYTGLDRFGRPSDQFWFKSGTPATTTDRLQIAYDPNSNVNSRNNLVDAVFSELYHASGAGHGYDNFDQLAAWERGTLSASSQGGPLDTVVSPTRQQGWSDDALGNWLSFTTNGSAQTRSVNQENQYTAVSGATTPVYDANGNLTTDETGKNIIYDAWNHPVTVKSGSTTLAGYSNNSLGERIVETENGTTTDIYFNNAWQALEERVGGSAKTQNVWNPNGTDMLVERDRDINNDGTWAERLYVQQDTNGNVTALVNTSGSVVERFVYDPFGTPTALSPTWGTPGTDYAMRYLFQGGRYDVQTGYYNFRNRDLSPTLGRWLQNDPLGFEAGDSNLYRYVNNQPVSFQDPNGLQPPNPFAPGQKLTGLEAQRANSFGDKKTLFIVGHITPKTLPVIAAKEAGAHVDLNENEIPIQPQTPAELAKLIRSAVIKNKGPFERIVIWGHFGGKEKKIPGVEMGPSDWIKNGKTSSKFRFDIKLNDPGVIKEIQEGLTKNGYLQLVSCNYQHLLNSWGKDAQAFANQLKINLVIPTQMTISPPWENRKRGWLGAKDRRNESKNEFGDQIKVNELTPPTWIIFKPK